MYLAGAPAFGHIMDEKREMFLAPFGQTKICQSVLREIRDKEGIINALATEYYAVISGLKKIGVEFYISRFSDKIIPKEIWQGLRNSFGCDFAVLPDNFPREFACYPRDMLTVLEGCGIILLNPVIGRRGIEKRGDYLFAPSPYGEGGRVLASGQTMLVAKKLIINGEKVNCDKELDILKSSGARIGFLPIPLSGIYNLEEIKESVFSNDHLDRVSNLIRGKDGALHLVLDPKICTLDEIEPGKWSAFGPKESIEKIRECCQPLEIEVHIPQKLEIPYAINFQQFPGGQALMTSGDKSLTTLVKEIIGKENIVETEVPIKFTPVYNQAGIRCLINELPEPMIKSLCV